MSPEIRVRLDGNKIEQTAKIGGSNDAVSVALSTGNVGNVSNTISLNDQKTQTELNKLKNDINSLCAKLGVTSSQVFSIFGQNIFNEEILTVNECQKRKKALEAAIKDATINGQLDKKKAIELTKNYIIALNTGWSIEGLKKQNTSCGASGLKERLFALGYLKKADNVSDDKLERAIKSFFNDFFNDKINKAKTPHEREKIAKQQLQTFGRLLVNTKGEERELFTKVLANLIQENRLEGTKNVFLSMLTDEEKQKFAAKMKNDMPKIADGLKDEDLIQIEALRAVNLSADDKKQLPNDVKLQWQEFFKKYSEADIKAVIELYKNKSSIENVPENLKEAFKEYTYLVNISSGDKTGLAVKDSNFTEAEHLNINRELDSNIKDFGTDTYNAVQVKTAEIIDKHPELLNMSREEIVEFLDKVSDGQFSAIVKESGAAPTLVKGDAASSSGVGFKQLTSEEEQILMSAATDEKIQELWHEENGNKFVVEKSGSKNNDNQPNNNSKFNILSNLSGNDLMEGLAKKYIKMDKILKQFNDLTNSAKEFVVNLLESMSKSARNYCLNKLSGNNIVAIVTHSNIGAECSIDELSGLTTAQKMIIEQSQQKHKNANFELS